MTRFQICCSTGGPSPIYVYEKLNLFQSVLSHNLRDLHIYKGLYGERNIAENKEKLLLNFITNCLPELQWCVLRSMWLFSRFVVFPSINISTICFLFQNFTNLFFTRAEIRADCWRKAAVKSLKIKLWICPLFMYSTVGGGSLNISLSNGSFWIKCQS